MSAPDGAGTAKRRAIRTWRTWSLITLRASAREARARARARLYAAVEPAKADAITVRWASCRSLPVIGICAWSTTCAKVDVSATSRSPVTLAAAPTALAETLPHGVVHCTPRGNRSCPAVRSVLKPRPAIDGAWQRAGFLVQSHTQAAAGLSGSRSLG